MNRFRLRFASALVPRPITRAGQAMLPILGCVLFIAVVALVQGCANNVASQQMSAYSIATGFLTLCDDGDFDYALQHFAKPLKASAVGATWTKNMQDNRGNYGIPVIRALVSRDTLELSRKANDPAKMQLVFRTSFVGTTPAEESVWLDKFSGKWQVYDYKFRPSGKPPADLPKTKIKKTWEEQTDDDQSQY
jgi:hypothetical protein